MITHFQKHLVNIFQKIITVKWSVYNQSLVRRGELLIVFDVIDNWDSELKQMNKDKIGEPFHYPNTFLLLLGYAKVYFYYALQTN